MGKRRFEDDTIISNDKVTHKVYGVGTVLQVLDANSPIHRDAPYTVEFESGRQQCSRKELTKGEGK